MKAKRPKESNLLERSSTLKDILNKISWIRLLKGFSPSVSWKKNISHTKGHYGWKNLNQISDRKQSGRTQKEKILESSKYNKMAWKWATNEYICSHPVTILWCQSWKKSEGKSKMNFIYWPQESYQDFEILVPLSYWTIINVKIYKSCILEKSGHLK